MLLAVRSGQHFGLFSLSLLYNLCSSSPALCAAFSSSPSAHVILSVPYLSVRLHLQDAVISLARLDVYCEAEIENGL